MRKKQDTNLAKDIKDVKFELASDDLITHDTLVRKRTT